MRLADTQDSQLSCTETQRLALAQKAIALLRADPKGLQGIVLHGQHGPIEQALKKSLVDHFQPITLPHNVSHADLQGGLDSSATFSTGTAIYQTGLLARSNKNGLFISAAQRLPSYISGALSAAIDNKRNGDSANCPFVVIATDDSLEQEPGIHASALAERLALHIVVPNISLVNAFYDIDAVLNQSAAAPDSLALLENTDTDTDTDTPAKTNTVLSSNLKPYQNSDPGEVILTDKILKEFTCLAVQLGITSMLPLLHCCRVARGLAALDNRKAVSKDDALLAVQLALAPHAQQLPEAEAPSDEHQSEPQGQSDQEQQTEQHKQEELNQTESAPPSPLPDHPQQESDVEQLEADNSHSEDTMQEQMVAAAQAALPQHLLASLAQTQARSAQAGCDKKTTSAGRSGRPIGVLRPRGGLSGQRINILETLKAAIPMQRIRRDEASYKQTTSHTKKKLFLRRDDLRVTRYRQSSRTTTVFVVDASGSSAMHRLAEAKGAVELLLAECYIRRDRVALITFRGTTATLDLPPTRSLTRAKRALQNLPGGGGTPLAAGIQLAHRVLSSLSMEGEAPIAVFMTDAKANIALDGSASRETAMLDAERQSQLLKTTTARLLFVDTATRQGPKAKQLSKTMGANYFALPKSNAQALPSLISSYSQ